MAFTYLNETRMENEPQWIGTPLLVIFISHRAMVSCPNFGALSHVSRLEIRRSRAGSCQVEGVREHTGAVGGERREYFEESLL